MKRILALSAAACLAAASAFADQTPAPAVQGPAPAAPSVASAAGPNVLPGADGGGCVLTNSCVFATPTTTFAGDASSRTYNLPPMARWGTPQRLEAGYHRADHVATSRVVTLLAAHQPGDADVAAGKDSDICGVDFSVDGGAVVTVTEQTLNPDDNRWGYNVTLTNSNFADGYHHLDAVVRPCNGASLTMRGPLEFSTSDHAAEANTNGSPGEAGILVSDGSGTTAGNIMTVFPNPTFGWNRWRDGWDVAAIGLEHNSRILGSSTVNPALCATPQNGGQACTGAGGAGTYYISGAPQLITTKTPAQGGAHKSLWFFTNYRGTLHRNVVYVAATGTDGGTHGDRVADPVRHIGAAAARAWARDEATHGLYGAVICVVGPGTFEANGAGGYRLRTAYGYTEIVGAESDPRCGVTGPPPARTIVTDTGANSSGGNAMERWAHLTIKGALEADLFTIADHVTAYGYGLNFEINGHYSALLVYQATACTNNVLIGYYSGCRGEIVSGNTMRFITEDFFHGASVITDNTLRDGGAVWLRITGTATAGSNVITGVSVPDGLTISQLFAVGTKAASIDVGNCFARGGGDGYVAAVDDAAHTITLKNMKDDSDYNAVCTVTGSLNAVGVHGDAYQFQDGLFFTDVFITGNDANDPTIGYQQGLFVEKPLRGLYFKGNKFYSQQTPEYFINVADEQYGWTLSGNTWNEAGSSTSGFNLNGDHHRFWLDMNNTCQGATRGGFKSYRPRGPNSRVSGGSCH